MKYPLLDPLDFFLPGVSMRMKEDEKGFVLSSVSTLHNQVNPFSYKVPALFLQLILLMFCTA